MSNLSEAYQQKLRAFQNCELTKTQLKTRMAEHYSLDEIIKGRTGDEGKGCTVWCALNTYDHSKFPSVLGLPIWLAQLIDQIFETLPNGEAQQFSLDWPSAIPEGANLDLVLHQFLHALLVDLVGGVIRHAPDSPSILAVAALHQRAIDGDAITPIEWRSAAERSEAEVRWAAAEAEEARWAAEEARWAAAAERWAAAHSAARSAQSAAAAAARWATAAERSEAAAARWQRDLLLRLLRSI